MLVLGSEPGTPLWGDSHASATTELFLQRQAPHLCWLLVWARRWPPLSAHSETLAYRCNYRSSPAVTFLRALSQASSVKPSPRGRLSGPSLVSTEQGFAKRAPGSRCCQLCLQNPPTSIHGACRREVAIPVSHYISMQPESLRKLQCDFEGMGLRRGGNSSQHQLPRASLGNFLKAS